ncbi:MAG: sigma-70 family RNA polymerase sigma factor [Verrucomicrobiales bacterium]
MAENAKNRKPGIDTSATLLMRVRDAEDEAAWGEFVRLYAPFVFNYCLRRGLQPADAEDLTQEVMNAMPRGVRAFDYDPAKGGFRAWLFRIVRNKLADYFRKAGRRPDLAGGDEAIRALEDQPSEEEAVDFDRDYKQRLFAWASERVRSEIADHTWQAFWRTAVKGEAPSEVADSLGMSVGAVYVAKSRAIARIRAVIEATTGEPDAAA